MADIKKEEAAIARCGEEIASVSQRLTRLKAAGTSNSDLEEQLNFKNAEKRQLQREREEEQRAALRGETDIRRPEKLTVRSADEFEF